MYKKKSCSFVDILSLIFTIAIYLVCNEALEKRHLHDMITNKGSFQNWSSFETMDFMR